MIWDRMSWCWTWTRPSSPTTTVTTWSGCCDWGPVTTSLSATAPGGGGRVASATGIEPVAAAVAVEAPRVEVAVGFAVLKGGRSEHIVQKLTELGVDRIVPFAAERSVVRWDEAKAAGQVERWRRVAREAVMQCRRPWLPHLEPVRAFGDLDLSGAALAVPGGRALAPGENFVLIGPEGGWTGTELAAATRHVGLGPHVLRAETAAVAAASVLGARRSGHLPAAEGSRSAAL